jgi:hypothetical protein
VISVGTAEAVASLGEGLEVSVRVEATRTRA